MGINHSQQNTVKTLSNVWLHSDAHGMKCPICNANLILVQAEERQDWENPYQTYDTIVECMSCSYKTHAISYTILGSVNHYDVDHVTINGWSPSGSRVETSFEHILDYHLLKELQSSEELVEFLIVDNHVIQVVG